MQPYAATCFSKFNGRWVIAYDYVLRFSGRCANCASGQTSLFPAYPTGNSYASRFFSSEILANPGDNTPSGRFGKPARREVFLEAAAEGTAVVDGRLSWSVRGRLARARGNYGGLIEQENGTGETKLTSLFAFPASPLTRAQYAIGPLDSAEPGYLRLQARYADLLLKNFSATLEYSWIEGRLRTPLIANAFAPYPGLIPGVNPQYYLFRLNETGYPSRQVLKDYTAVKRGSLGRNPGLSNWDMRLEYRRPLSGGTFAVSLTVNNVLNTTRVLGFDDAVETPMGYTEPVAESSAGLVPPRFATFPDVTRTRNPAYGMPLAVQNPRTVRVGAQWSF